MSPSVDFAKLQEIISEQRSTEYESIHGLEHWNQVEYNGLFLAEKTGADVLVVRLFSLFHDSRRLNDDYDPEHGLRGAEFAKTLRNKYFELDNERFEMLYTACAFHTELHKTGNPTIDTCFDADRLDLGRVGILPLPNKMATSYGSKLASKILKASISPFKVRQWLASLKG